LAKYRAADGSFAAYDKLTGDELQGPVTALAEDLSTLQGTLGLRCGRGVLLPRRQDFVLSAGSADIASELDKKPAVRSGGQRALLK